MTSAKVKLMLTQFYDVIQVIQSWVGKSRSNRFPFLKISKVVCVEILSTVSVGNRAWLSILRRKQSLKSPYAHLLCEDTFLWFLWPWGVTECRAPEQAAKSITCGRSLQSRGQEGGVQGGKREEGTQQGERVVRGGVITETTSELLEGGCLPQKMTVWKKPWRLRSLALSQH